MGKLGEMLIALKVKTNSFVDRVTKDESGDTNFISIAIIIAIVVVLAGVFIAFGKPAIEQIGKKVKEFIDNPH